jgi:hypothetical protein
MSEQNFFEKFGLSVSNVDYNSLEVGKSYPIYGAITRIKQETPDVIVELNFSIEAKLNIGDAQDISLIKSRAFESGVFVCEILALEPTIQVHCNTIIFGKKTESMLQ